jgi:hypothetical protein
MFVSPLMRRLAVGFASAGLLTGCLAEPMIDARSPSSPPLEAPAPDGWTTVTQPGWMHADFPAAPRGFSREDRTHQGRYAWKGLNVQSPGAYVELRYVEYRDPKDVAEAKAGLPRKLESLPPGVHAQKIEPISVAGAEGMRLLADVDPKSSTNGAPFALIERTQWLWQGGRLFWMDCATPKEKVAICERFFASFTIEAPAP